MVDSRVPDEALSFVHRRDPYWEPFVADLASAWVDPTLFEGADLEGPLDKVLRGRLLRGRRMRTLGAVGQWRTLTDDQVRSLTGQVGKDRDYDDVALLHKAGLVERQSLSYKSDGAVKHLKLARPCTGRPARRLLRSVTPWENIGVTDGRPWGRGPSHSRHNVLASELGLRIAESTCAAAVVGERVGSLRGDGSAPIADLTVFRPDSLRVMVEVTATSNPKDAEKISRYAEWLSENPSAPVVVMFVIAVPAGRSDLTFVGSALRRHIDEVCNWGSRSDNLEDRFAVVRWGDWFPSSLELDSSFQTLRVTQPTYGGGDWRETDLFASEFLEGRSTEDDIDRMTLASASYGCPYWLRPDNANDVIGEAVSEAARRSTLGPSLAWIYDHQFPREMASEGTV